MVIVIGAGVVDGTSGARNGAAEFAGDHDGGDIEQRALASKGVVSRPLSSAAMRPIASPKSLGWSLARFGGMDVELLGQHIDGRARQRQAEASRDQGEALLLRILARDRAASIGETADGHAGRDRARSASGRRRPTCVPCRARWRRSGAHEAHQLVFGMGGRDAAQIVRQASIEPARNGMTPE